MRSKDWNPRGSREVFEAFSDRTLSHDGDALRAMAGILRRMSEEGPCSFVQGLPITYIWNALIFRSRHTSLRRRTGFASYSWAGWKGSILFFAEFLRKSEGGPWKIIDPPGNETPIMAEPTEYDQQCLEDLTSLAGTPILVKALSIDQLRLQGSYEHLQLWTLTLFFRLVHIDTLTGICHIQGISGSNRYDTWLDGVDDDDFFSANLSGAFEFAVLLENHRPLYTYDSFSAILLNRHDGIAERRGLARLPGAALRESLPPGPIWTEIILG